jgi:hypothetical protein
MRIHPGASVRARRLCQEVLLLLYSAAAISQGAYMGTPLPCQSTDDYMGTPLPCQSTDETPAPGMRQRSRGNAHRLAPRDNFTKQMGVSHRPSWVLPSALLGC